MIVLLAGIIVLHLSVLVLLLISTIVNVSTNNHSSAFRLRDRRCKRALNGLSKVINSNYFLQFVKTNTQDQI